MDAMHVTFKDAYTSLHLERDANIRFLRLMYHVTTRRDWISTRVYIREGEMKIHRQRYSSTFSLLILWLSLLLHKPSSFLTTLTASHVRQVSIFFGVKTMEA